MSRSDAPSEPPTNRRPASGHTDREPRGGEAVSAGFNNLADLTEMGSGTLPEAVRAASGALDGAAAPSLNPFATSLNTVHASGPRDEGDPSGRSDTVQMPEHPANATPAPAGSAGAGAVAELTAAGLITRPDAAATARGGLGVVAGRYELRGLLGAGGRGLVFLAHDRLGDCPVAVKTLRPEFLAHAAARKGFVAEAKEMNRIPAHAGVLVVKDFGGVEKPFYVTEYLRGGTLGEAIRADGPLEATRVLRYARDVAGALAYVHTRHGKLHRDVKPGNVLLDGDGSARLADFGLVWRVGMGERGFRAGTMPYMPPEVLGGGRKDVGFEWDVYGFGATLYEMLAGRAPYADRLKKLPRSSGGETGLVALRKMVGESAPTPILTLNREANRRLVQIAGWAMARDPRGRYFGAGEMLEDLERVAQGLPPRGPQRGGENTRGKRPPGRGRWTAIAGLALGIGGAASLLLASMTPYANVQGGTPGAGAPRAALASVSGPDTAPGPMLTQVRLASPLGLSFEAVGGTRYRIGRPGRWSQLRGQRFASASDLPWDPVAERAALAFVAKAERPAYLTVLSRDSDGALVQLLPNVFEPDNWLMAGVPRAVPRPLAEGSTPYWFEAAAPAGTDTVWAVLTERPFEIVGGDAVALPGSGFRGVPDDFKIAVAGRVFDSFEDAFADRWQTAELTVTVSGPAGP